MAERPLVGLLLVGLAVVSGGCGVIGPPVAPEDVGLGPRIEMMKKQEAAERERAAKKQPIPPVEPEVVNGVRPAPEEEVPLPPLMPVGGR